MDEFAFEFVEAFNVGPFPVAALLVFIYSTRLTGGILENSTRVDKDIAFVLEYPVSCFNSDSPFAFVIVPPRILDRMLVLDIFLDFILRNRFLQIIVYLSRSSIIIRPLGIRLKRIRIVMRWDIALTAGVSTFQSI